MVMCPGRRSLFIIAGQRDGANTPDLWEFNLETETAREICHHFSYSYAEGGHRGPPLPFFTRAVVDEEVDEIYM